MDFYLPAEYPLARALRLRRLAQWCGAHPRFLLLLDARVKEEGRLISQRHPLSDVRPVTGD